MQEMSKMFGGGMDAGMFQTEETLVLNKNNKLIQALFALKDDASRKEDAALIISQVYDLAMMSHKPLPTDQMTRFITRSNQILERIAM